MRFDIKKAAMLAAILVVAMIAVNYVMQALLGQTVQTLFSTINVPGIGSVDISLPQAYSPISGTVGGQLLGWLSGVIPGGLDLTLIVTLFLSALVTLLVGGFIVDQFNLPTFKGQTGRLASVIIWGSVPLYILVKGLVLPSISIMGLVGLFAYTFVAAFATGFIGKMLKVNI